MVVKTSPHLGVSSPRLPSLAREELGISDAEGAAGRAYEGVAVDDRRTAS